MGEEGTKGPVRNTTLGWRLVYWGREEGADEAHTSSAGAYAV